MSQFFTTYSRHLGTNLGVTSGSVAATVVTLTGGSQLFSSVTSSGTGLVDFVFTEPSKKLPIVVGSVGGTGRNYFISNEATTGFRLNILDNSLAAVDGSFSLFFLDSNFDATESFAATPLHSYHPGTRIILGSIFTQTGSPFVGKNVATDSNLLGDANRCFSVSSTAVDNVTVTYDQGFQRIGAVCIMNNTASTTGYSVSQTTNGFTVVFRKAADALQTNAQTFIAFAAIGFDSPEDVSSLEAREVSCNLRNAIVSSFKFDMPGNTASVNDSPYTLSGGAGFASFSHTTVSLLGCGSQPTESGNLDLSGQHVFGFGSCPNSSNYLRYALAPTSMALSSGADATINAVIFQAKGNK